MTSIPTPTLPHPPTHTQIPPMLFGAKLNRKTKCSANIAHSISRKSCCKSLILTYCGCSAVFLYNHLWDCTILVKSRGQNFHNIYWWKEKEQHGIKRRTDKWFLPTPHHLFPVSRLPSLEQIGHGMKDHLLHLSLPKSEKRKKNQLLCKTETYACMWTETVWIIGLWTDFSRQKGLGERWEDDGGRKWIYF